MKNVVLSAFSAVLLAMTASISAAPAKLESLVLGGGCFWCTEAAYELLPGVKNVVSGYAGGHVPNPTYEQICKIGRAHV